MANWGAIYSAVKKNMKLEMTPVYDISTHLNNERTVINTPLKSILPGVTFKLSSSELWYFF